MNRANISRFIRVLRAELIQEFQAYGPKFSPILDESQTEWPSSYEKRWITDTGALRDSLQVTATESSVSFNWGVKYANRIQYGWVTKSGASRRGRDWVALILKKHPIRDAVRQAALSATQKSPGFRLIR